MFTVLNIFIKKRMTAKSRDLVSAVYVSPPSLTEPSWSLIRACWTLCHSASLLLLYFLFSTIIRRAISTDVATTTVRHPYADASAVMLVVSDIYTYLFVAVEHDRLSNDSNPIQSNRLFQTTRSIVSALDVSRRCAL